MDRHTPEQRRKNMQRVRSKDTRIELLMRKALWNAGIRYRKNYKKLPGKPDIAITKYRIAVFCDSSFWHGRDYETKKKPQTNAEFWDKKIRRNIERDQEVDCQLRAIDWMVLRFWDDEIINSVESCVKAVEEAVFDRIIEDLEKTSEASEDSTFITDDTNSLYTQEKVPI